MPQKAKTETECTVVPIMVAIIRTKAAFRSSVMLLYFPVAYPSLTRWMQAKASGMASPLSIARFEARSRNNTKSERAK